MNTSMCFKTLPAIKYFFQTPIYIFGPSSMEASIYVKVYVELNVVFQWFISILLFKLYTRVSGVNLR